MRSLQFMFSGKAYYALALFDDDQGHYRKTIYRLTIDSHFLRKYEFVIYYVLLILRLL